MGSFAVSSSSYLGANLEAVVKDTHVEGLSHFDLHLVRVKTLGGITHMEPRISDGTIQRSIKSMHLAVLVD